MAPPRFPSILTGWLSERTAPSGFIKKARVVAAPRNRKPQNKNMCATHFALLQVFQGLEVTASLKSTGAKVLKNPLLKRGKTTAPDLARSKTETATKNRTINPHTSINTNGGSKASPQAQSKSLITRNAYKPSASRLL